jgi:hypothetical protein
MTSHNLGGLVGFSLILACHATVVYVNDQVCCNGSIVNPDLRNPSSVPCLLGLLGNVAIVLELCTTTQIAHLELSENTKLATPHEHIASQPSSQNIRNLLFYQWHHEPL